MKILNQIPAWLKNKYLLTIVGFVIWMLFFDDRDVFATSQKKHELSDLQNSKRYYQQQIDETKKELDQLKINVFTIEKYAREKYLMKRDNEDLFIIQPTQKAQ